MDVVFYSKVASTVQCVDAYMPAGYCPQSTAVLATLTPVIEILGNR